MITPKHRVGYIDGLRAVAILSVVACHAAQYSTLSPNATIAFLFKQGSHGVNLFFVLSGFCLAYPTLERLRQKGNAAFDIPRYAARRVVRNSPALLCDDSLVDDCRYRILASWRTVSLVNAGAWIHGD